MKPRISSRRLRVHWPSQARLDRSPHYIQHAKAENGQSKTTLALFLRLPDATVDLTSWNHWRLPAMGKGIPALDGDLGPVLVTVEYEVAPDQATDFLKAVRQYRRIRRRDGARKWGIFRDTENVNRYVETFAIRG